MRMPPPESAEHGHGRVRVVEPQQLLHRVQVAGNGGGDRLRQRLEWPVSWRGDDRTPVRGKPGEEAGPKKGRLACARGADERQQPWPLQFLQDGLDIGLAPTDLVRVTNAVVAPIAKAG